MGSVPPGEREEKKEIERKQIQRGIFTQRTRRTQSSMRRKKKRGVEAGLYVNWFVG
jgi:hypothetical protein